MTRCNTTFNANPLQNTERLSTRLWDYGSLRLCNLLGPCPNLIKALAVKMTSNLQFVSLAVDGHGVRRASGTHSSITTPRERGVVYLDSQKVSSDLLGWRIGRSVRTGFGGGEGQVK